MTEQTQPGQQTDGRMTYPSGGLRKLFFNMPVYLWRMGLGWALPRTFLLLTHRGRKSGAPRHTMLEHYRYDGNYYVTSGWGSRAQWVQNVRANPQVTVQTWRDGATGAQAVQVQGDAELTGLYHHLKQTSAFWDPYLKSLGIENTLADFLAKRDRVLIVRLTPTAEPGPPPLRADLVWVWAVVAVLALGQWWSRR